MVYQANFNFINLVYNFKQQVGAKKLLRLSTFSSYDKFLGKNHDFSLTQDLKHLI